MLSTTTVFHFLGPIWCLSICSWTGIIGAYKWVMDRDLLWSSITFSRQSQSFPLLCHLSLLCLSLRSESFLLIFSFSSLGTAKISPGTHEPFSLLYSMFCLSLFSSFSDSDFSHLHDSWVGEDPHHPSWSQTS